MSENEWYDVEIRNDGQMTEYQLDIDESGGARQPATTTVLYKRVTVPLGRAWITLPQQS